LSEPGQTLHVVAGPAAGQDLRVDGDLLIGRNASGAGALGADPALSRDHARLRRSAQGELLVEDLRSTNGTRVNGVPITALTSLRPGDRIELGGTTLEVRGAPAPAGPVALGPIPALGRQGADRGRDGDPMRAARRRQVVLAAILVLVVGAAVAVAAGVGGGGGDGGAATAGAAAADFDGTIYIESNQFAPGSNSVLAFRYRGGSLRPLNVREYPTGGSGAHDLTNSGALDAEQQIVTNADNTLLFAPNTGSDTIAVFHIADDGTLTPVKGSPFPSLGKGPASVGVSGDLLFVANKAQDGIRELKQEPASYATFRIGKDGALTPVGQPLEAPPESSPTQTYVVPHGGKLMLATEENGPEAGPFRAFTIGDDGLHQAPGSPLPLDDRVFAPGPRRAPAWPQGLIAHPKLPLIYAGVANLRKLVVYEYDPSGRLSYVSSQVNKGTVLPCWTQINRAGTRLYTGNAGSDNISVFDIAKDPRNPVQIQRVKLHGAGFPWNFQIDPTGRHLFIVNMRAVAALPPGKGNTLHSFDIAADGTLKEVASSPVPIPVPLGTNPWGMALVPER
jgi:6-phosphogluconolactonase (cycloisomerase 2 family)